jgi:aminoglycoside phosphotransferase (APT) family kinase protein
VSTATTARPGTFDGGEGSVEWLRKVLGARRPDLARAPITFLGSGLDNAAYRIGKDLVARISTATDPGKRSPRVRREAHLLAAVADLSPLPVPRPRLTVAEEGLLVCSWLPGRPLLEAPPAQRAEHAATVAGALGGLLATLHRLPGDDAAGLVDRDDTPPGEWLDEARTLTQELGTAIPARHRAALARFLEAPPPEPAAHPVLTHGDLGIEHVLVDPSGARITGVVDWTDAAVTDPATDLGRILRDLGPDALDAALDTLRPPSGDGPALRLRAGFYARCLVLEDLAYGLDTGRAAYVAKSLTGLGWLFPA